MIRYIFSTCDRSRGARQGFLYRISGGVRRLLCSDSCARPIGVYAGSFNPPTSGHIDMIIRSLNFCDKVVVGIGFNIEKSYAFSADERAGLLRKAIYSETTEWRRVEVLTFQGLLADFALDVGGTVIVRGVRNDQDLQFETSRALLNQKMSGIESVFLPSRDPTVSSSIVREMAAFNTSVPGIVPPSIEEEVYTKLGVHFERDQTTGELRFPRGRSDT